MTQTAEARITYTAVLHVQGWGWKVFSVVQPRDWRNTALGLLIQQAEEETGGRVDSHAWEDDQPAPEW
jgi:hypothetical protein